MIKLPDELRRARRRHLVSGATRDALPRRVVGVEDVQCVDRLRTFHEGKSATARRTKDERLVSCAEAFDAKALDDLPYTEQKCKPSRVWRRPSSR